MASCSSCWENLVQSSSPLIMAFDMTSHYGTSGRSNKCVVEFRMASPNVSSGLQCEALQHFMWHPGEAIRDFHVVYQMRLMTEAIGMFDMASTTSHNRSHDGATWRGIWCIEEAVIQYLIEAMIWLLHVAIGFLNDSAILNVKAPLYTNQKMKLKNPVLYFVWVMGI